MEHYGTRERPYRFEVLDPRSENAALFEGPVYGIEVTIPKLAARCAANLDPQHLGGKVTTAAIEAAVEWELPPLGSTLVTVRPDPDSIGAMAVLALRAAGSAKAIRPERVALIAESDKEAAGPWPGPRPIATPEELLSPIAGIAGFCFDPQRHFNEKVDRMVRWLLGEAGTDAFLTFYERKALREAEAALADLQVTHHDGMAVVVGAHRMAFAVGYRVSPVVVATNPAFQWQGGEPHRKHSVGRWNHLVSMDWDGMLTELQRAEPGWGGSSSIVGSPQGRGSVLTTDEVVEIVRCHLGAS